MTREEAQHQLEAFFRKLGITVSFFEDKNFAKATVGEAVIGFEFVEADGFLKTRALIYRFRNNPNPILIEAIFAEQNNADTGGGHIYFDDDLALSLEKTFDEELPDEEFFTQINRLARASLVWSTQILPQLAESVHSS